MMEHKQCPITFEDSSITTLTPKRHKADLSLTSKVFSTPLHFVVWFISICSSEPVFCYVLECFVLSSFILRMFHGTWYCCPVFWTNGAVAIVFRVVIRYL